MIHPETTPIADDGGEGGAGRARALSGGRRRARRAPSRSCAAHVCRDASPARCPTACPPRSCRRAAAAVAGGVAARAAPAAAGSRRAAALRALNDGVAPPQRRLVFDEFFFLQLGLARRRGTARREPGLALTGGEARASERWSNFSAQLPFTPTGAQKRAIDEIARDWPSRIRCTGCCRATSARARRWWPGRRASWPCASGFQAAVMAPTEILAEQHARTLEPAGPRRPADRWRC